MNSSSNSIPGTPALPKDDLVIEVERVIVDVKPAGADHVVVVFAGADGRNREALARADRAPAIGATGKFRAYRNMQGLVSWRFAFTVNTESEESAANA